MRQKIVPSILLVDDKPDSQGARRHELEANARVKVLHPNELEIKDLIAADLVLVDFQLDDWPERDRISQISMCPSNGLALAAVLKAHLENKPKTRPTAFAIYSAHLDQLSGGPREWSIARANNLEWAFSKNQAGNDISLVQQIRSLANAVLCLPKDWPTEDSGRSWDQVSRLFALPEKAIWYTRAAESIQECHPPIYRLSHGSHGLAFLRWFLQRILPYPCFLWDIHFLAARCRITRASLETALAESRTFKNALETYSYRGILGDFLGQRWWRPGIETFLWHLTDGHSNDSGLVRTKLQALTKIELEPLELAQPTVCLDEEYRPLKHFCDIDKAVRIQPEDWPTYADQAWTSIDLARENSSLGALVVGQDKSRLTAE